MDDLALTFQAARPIHFPLTEQQPERPDPSGYTALNLTYKSHKWLQETRSLQFAQPGPYISLAPVDAHTPHPLLTPHSLVPL